MALKILPAWLTLEPEQVKRFQFEARAVAALNHPNILTLYEIGDWQGQHFIATEYVEGTTLRQRLAHGPLTLNEPLTIATQIVTALMVVHRAGIVHRDIKPENVIIRPDGLVKVLDFGLAKLVTTAAAETPQTNKAVDSFAGAIRGTLQYMSPEQLRGLTVDERTDIFSFGVLLYEILSRQLPFARPEPDETLRAILEETPANLFNMPAHVAALVMRCLEKDRSKRWPSAEVLLAALSQAAGTSEGGQLHFRMPSQWQPSIVVLPFANLSADEQNNYFCDGLAEELLNSLANLKYLSVVARTSAFAFKGKNVDVREIGRQLNAAYVLEGSVRQSGERLRITAQLINVATGYHLWSERYDRQGMNVFAIQEDIAAAIAKTLSSTLLTNSSAVRPRHPDNEAAYDCYLKGRYHGNRPTPDGLRQALFFYEQALQLAPDYALAYASIAQVHVSLSFWGHTPQESVRECRAALQQSLALNDSLPEARVALASSKFLHDWDLPVAEKEFQRVIDLAPNYATTYFSYAYLLASMRRFDEANASATHAVSLDPLSLYATMVLGWMYWFARRYEPALERGQRLIEVEPSFFGGHWLRGLSRYNSGQTAEGIADLEQAVKLGGGAQILAGLGFCYGQIGCHTEAETVLQKLIAGNQQHSLQAYLPAVVCSGLGRVDEAFHWLEKSFVARDDVLLNINITPALDGLRADPRFEDLLHRIGLKYC